MKKILLIVLLLTIPAMAQDVAKNAAAPQPPAKVEEAKAKPVIIDKIKLMELDNLRLALENAQLKAAAAVPADLKKAITDANDAVVKFWQAVGVKPEEIGTKWTVTDGIDGAKILTVKEVAPTLPPK